MGSDRDWPRETEGTASCRSDITKILQRPNGRHHNITHTLMDLAIYCIFDMTNNNYSWKHIPMKKFVTISITAYSLHRIVIYLAQLTSNSRPQSHYLDNKCSKTGE